MSLGSELNGIICPPNYIPARRPETTPDSFKANRAAAMVIGTTDPVPYRFRRVVRPPADPGPLSGRARA